MIEFDATMYVDHDVGYRSFWNTWHQKRAISSKRSVLRVPPGQAIVTGGGRKNFKKEVVS
jgi:hypothetical protein